MSSLTTRSSARPQPVSTARAVMSIIRAGCHRTFTAGSFRMALPPASAADRRKGFSLRQSVTALRQAAGLGSIETIRGRGAPIPLRPLRRWDNGRDVIVAGDAAGVVAPASGEGIYYAMEGGRLAAEAAHAFLASGDPRALGSARRRFMRAHGKVFWILGIMQWFWYSSDKRRERFVSICRDPDVQRLTWDAYMNKRLMRRKPIAHVRIFFKDLAHLLGVVRRDGRYRCSRPVGSSCCRCRRVPDRTFTLVSCAEAALMAAAGLAVRPSLDSHSRPWPRCPCSWRCGSHRIATVGCSSLGFSWPTAC